MWKSRRERELEKEVERLINKNDEIVKAAMRCENRENAAYQLLTKYMESNRALQKGLRRLSRKVKRQQADIAELKDWGCTVSESRKQIRDFATSVPAGVNGLHPEDTLL